MFTAANVLTVSGGVFALAAAIQASLVIFELVRRQGQNREAEKLLREALALRVCNARASSLSRESAQAAWNGFRKFVVSRKEFEAENTYSFYLTPHDRRPPAPFSCQGNS